MVSIDSKDALHVIVVMNVVVPESTSSGDEEGFHVVKKLGHEDEHEHPQDKEDIFSTDISIGVFGDLAGVGVGDGSEGSCPERKEQDAHEEGVQRSDVH